MENREQRILSEIKSMMASIRVQLAELDAKMLELQQVVDPEGFANDVIDLDIEEDLPVEAQPEVVVDDDLPFEDVTGDIPEESHEETHEETPEVTPEEAPEETSVVEEEPMEETAEEPAEEEDLPGVFDLPEPVTVTVAAKAAVAAKPTVNDTMAAQQAWRTDMPGTPVKDIRSAISLNDRIIFINLLFKEDPMAFQTALTNINAMTELDQVVEFITAEYPEWDLNSDLVYRFMMAVRRKVR